MKSSQEWVLCFVVCSPKRMNDDRDTQHTVVTGTGFEILFYECMGGFVYGERKPVFQANAQNKETFFIT